MYDKELIDEIGKKANIVDVVGRYLNLIKKGKIYVAICPFHDDSNPSLQVNPERNTFHCWVDNHSGNAFSFVMQYEHVGFMEAVKKVAEIINFDDPRLHEKTYVKKVDENILPLYNVINDLNDYYEYALTTEEGDVAKAYLKNRNIDEEIIKKFHIGYSLNDGVNTIKFLKSRGHSLKAIEDIGIAFNKGDNTSDNNKGRLIFAITDSNNQVVGFSARKINEEEGPKYINTPETKIFIKSNILYNFYNAKQTAKADQYIYVLEGFMDVIALHKVGINSAVALMGTALSKNHIAMLKKLNVEVRLCLDGDNPGQEAMMRIVPQLLENNIKVRIVKKSDVAKDADEILNKGEKDVLKTCLNDLLSPFDFTINFYKDNKLTDSDEKLKLIDRFMPLLLATKKQLEFDDYVYKLADVTNFSASAIRKNVVIARNKKENNKDIEQDSDINPGKIVSTYHPETKELRRLAKAEKEILYHMLSHKEAIEFYEKYINAFYIDVYREVANFVIEAHERNNDATISDIITDIEMSESKNKEILKRQLEDLNETKKDRLKYRYQVLEQSKQTIDEEKKGIDVKQRILNATNGKTEEEKARVIADTLRYKK